MGNSEGNLDRQMLFPLLSPLWQDLVLASAVVSDTTPIRITTEQSLAVLHLLTLTSREMTPGHTMPQAHRLAGPVTNPVSNIQQPLGREAQLLN